MHAQQLHAAGGGDFSSASGKVSFSVGHILYTHISGTGGSSTHGVHHTYKVMNENYDDLKISTYPNPFTESIEVSSEEHNLKSLNYVILTTDGKVVNRGDFIRSTRIVLNALPAGLYELGIYHSNRKLSSKKIVKVEK